MKALEKDEALTDLDKKHEMKRAREIKKLYRCFNKLVGSFIANDPIN